VPAVLLIIAAAVLVRAAFGFGDALIAMPLLALVVPLRVATPLMGLVGPTIGILLIIRTWRRLDLRSTLVLAASTFAGIPVGLYVLKNVRETIVNIGLAAVIVLFALYSLVRPELPRLRSSRSAPFFGFAAGILGASTNTNGPPIALYGALRGWEPEAFRATIQGYLLLTGPAILIGQGAAGLLTGPVLRLYAYALPLIAAAVWLGLKLGRRIPTARFYRWIYGLLFGAGLVLLLRSLLR
jgi:uncharacterized membrane protein YfcA